MAGLSNQWYFQNAEGKAVGPFTGKQVKRLVDSGEVGPDTLLCREGESSWAPASSYGGLRELFRGTEQPAEAAQDAITATCDECEYAFRVTAQLEGRLVRCPACAAPVRIPYDALEEPEYESFDEDDYSLDEEFEQALTEAISAPRRRRKKPTPPPKKETPNWVYGAMAGVGGLVLLVAGIIAGTYFVSSGDNEGATPVAQTSEQAATPDSSENADIERQAAEPPPPDSDETVEIHPEPQRSHSDEHVAAVPEDEIDRVSESSQPNTKDRQEPFTVDGTGELPQLIRSVEPSIVKIETERALGSGFVVEGGLIATNRHVLEGAKKATVSFKSGQTYPVEGVLYDGGAIDLCIVRCKGLSPDDVPPLRLSTDTLSQGSEVFTFGAPKGLTFSVSDGIISANRWIDDAAYVQTTAPISSGNSGGPLLSTKDGSVVGMNTFVYREGQNLNFALSANHIQKALASLSDSITQLPLDAQEQSLALEEEAGRKPFVVMMREAWESMVISRREELNEQAERVRALVAQADSDAAHTALDLALAEIQHKMESTASTIQLPLPPINLAAQYGELSIGTFGYIQDNLQVLQILNEWNLLVMAKQRVFLLEDFPTDTIPTDIALAARKGPVMYISGVYRYLTKGGEDKQVYRLRPVWDLKDLSTQVIADEAANKRRSKAIFDTYRDQLTRRSWHSDEFTGESAIYGMYSAGGKVFAKLRDDSGREHTIDASTLPDEEREWLATFYDWTRRAELEMRRNDEG